MGHHHHHGHGHHEQCEHGHAHGRASPPSAGAFAIGVALNAAFVLFELGAGIFARSISLVADAAHNFGDVLGLLLAWGAMRLAARKPSRRRTYGLRRSTILASVANAVLLLVGVGAVTWEAVGRLSHGTEPRGAIMIAVAAVGVVVNAGSALPFLKGSRADANLRGAYMHLMADAGVSAGIVVAGALILLTHATWIDPVVSIGVSLLILASTWKLLRTSLDLALDAVPENIEPGEVRTFLEELEGVIEVHDLHIWAMSTTETALTAHLVMRPDASHAAFLRDVGHALTSRFRIDHPTLQVEPPDSPEPCRHAAEDVV